MSVTFKGTDLKQQFVVVKYKYKKRFFLPRYSSKDDDRHYKAQLFNSIEDAQKAIQDRRGDRLKRHKYKIEPAENYFGYSSWSFDRSYNNPLDVQLTNRTEAVERALKRDQKEMLSKAKQAFLMSTTETIGKRRIDLENKQKEMRQIEQEITMLELSRNEINAIDTNALAEQYKTKSEDMASILFTGKDEY